MRLEDRISTFIAEATRYRKETGRNLPRGVEKIEPHVGDWTLIHSGDSTKLGVNPNFNYSTTPFGIYGFLLTEEFFQNIKDNNLPFARGRSFLHVFKVKDSSRKGCIRVRADGTSPDLGWKEYEDYIDEMRWSLEGWSGKQWHRLEKKGKSKTYPHRFWRATRVVAEAISEGKLKGPVSSSNMPIAWTALLTKVLGITAVLDNGSEMIHSQEPVQGVVFRTSDLERLVTVPKEEMDRSESLATNGFSGRLDSIVYNLNRVADFVNGIGNPDPNDAPEYLERVLKMKDALNRLEAEGVPERFRRLFEGALLQVESLEKSVREKMERLRNSDAATV